MDKELDGRMGRAPYTPTDQDREQVLRMKGHGLTNKQIATLILNPNDGVGISKQTLHKHFQPELSRAQGEMVDRVAESLVNRALDVDHAQGAICAMFYLKCRGGWRQEDKITHAIEDGTGVLLAPVMTSAEDWIKIAEAQNAERTAPEE